MLLSFQRVVFTPKCKLIYNIVPKLNLLQVFSKFVWYAVKGFFNLIELCSKQLGSHVCLGFVALWILPKPLNKSSGASECLKMGSSSQVQGLQMQKCTSLLHEFNLLSLHLIWSVLLQICWEFHRKAVVQRVKLNWTYLIKLIRLVRLL